MAEFERLSFDDKVVLIFGCVSGIGYEIVKLLIAEKLKGLLLLDIEESQGDKLAQSVGEENPSVNAVFLRCDISRESDVKFAYEKAKDTFGFFDVVINCAGILNDANWRKEIQVNLVGTIDSSLQAWNLMRKDREGNGGTILNFSSIASVFIGPDMPVYSATKSGIKNFTECLGHSFHHERTGVRLIAICPHVTSTGIFSDIENKSLDKETGLRVKSSILSYELFKPEDVAKLVLEVFRVAPSGTSWLLSDKMVQIPPQDLSFM